MVTRGRARQRFQSGVIFVRRRKHPLPLFEKIKLFARFEFKKLSSTTLSLKEVFFLEISLVVIKSGEGIISSSAINDSSKKKISNSFDRKIPTALFLQFQKNSKIFFVVVDSDNATLNVLSYRLNELSLRIFT